MLQIRHSRSYLVSRVFTIEDFLNGKVKPILKKSKVYRCKTCKKTFKNKKALDGHQFVHKKGHLDKKPCKWDNCNESYGSSHLSTHESFCVHNPKNTKKCPECGKQVKRGNKFCNQSCAASYNNRKYPKRHSEQTKTNCNNCGVEYEYRPNREEGKYCSVKCMKELEQKQLFERVEKNGGWDGLLSSKGKPFVESSVRRHMGKYLRKKYGDKCMVDGCKMPYEVNPHTENGKKGISVNEVDHIDGNPDNWSLDNFQLLCPTHHRLTPNWGARGKGSDARRNRFKNVS